VNTNSDQLLQDLEDSMPQGVANSAEYEEDSDDGGLSELDDLLNDSLSEAREREQYQADLKARKRNFNGMSKEEVDFCNSRMAAFEAARIWRPTANIAVFARITCKNCGDSKRIFSRWMQKQQSRTTATSRRVVTLPGPTKSLPNIVAEEQRVSAVCPTCAYLLDLDTHNPMTLQEAME
jgi:hypothetical protein